MNAPGSRVLPEFSRPSVATLLAAIIGSIVDPVPASPEAHHSPPQPPSEAPPDVLEQLKSLLFHYDRRVAEIGSTEIPERLRVEYGEIRWMLLETVRYRATFGLSRGGRVN